MLAYHFKIPFPEDLTDEVFWDKWEQLRWILFFEAKRNSKEKGDVNL